MASVGQRVLLVEDDPEGAELLSGALTRAGYRVRVAGDGLTALRMADEFGLDVALVDIGLPELDGLELARRLKASPRHADVPLVCTTGYSDARTRSAAHDAGFIMHLAKPLDVEMVLEAVRTALVIRRDSTSPRSS